MNSQFELLPIPTNEMSKEELVSYLENWFEENGTIALEHGYPNPIFGYNFTTIRVNSISKKGVYARDANTKKECVIAFNKLTRFQLMRIIYLINDYFLYCMYEA